MSAKYRAVCFDLDGTLLDTLDDLADSANRTLAAHGLPAHPVEAYKDFVGDGMRTLVRRIVPEHLRDDDDLAEKMFQGARAQYAKRWAEKTRPYPGIPELLDELTSRGLLMAVLSNKPHDFTELCVAELLPHWKFHVVQGVSDDVPAKPDPTGVRRVAAALDVPADEFLYVGDTATDMKTATAGGMFAVGVLWGFRQADELRDNGAAVLIERPEELLDLL